MGMKNCYGYCNACPQAVFNNGKDYENPRTDRPQGACGMGSAHRVLLKDKQGKIRSYTHRPRILLHKKKPVWSN